MDIYIYIYRSHLNNTVVHKGAEQVAFFNQILGMLPACVFFFEHFYSHRGSAMKYTLRIRKGREKLISMPGNNIAGNPREDASHVGTPALPLTGAKLRASLKTHFIHRAKGTFTQLITLQRMKEERRLQGFGH